MAATPPLLTVEQLVDYGFREWAVAKHDKFDRQWGYTCSDKIGKKFSVAVRFWNFEQYSKPENEVFNGFDAEVHFELSNGKSFDMRCSVADMTPRQIVEWFDNIFNRLDCAYRERYDQYDPNEVGSCEKCRRYLSPEDMLESTLCPECQYESETGFRSPKLKKRK